MEKKSVDSTLKIVNDDLIKKKIFFLAQKYSESTIEQTKELYKNLTEQELKELHLCAFHLAVILFEAEIELTKTYNELEKKIDWKNNLKLDLFFYSSTIGSFYTRLLEESIYYYKQNNISIETFLRLNNIILNKMGFKLSLTEDRQEPEWPHYES